MRKHVGLRRPFFRAFRLSQGRPCSSNRNLNLAKKPVGVLGNNGACVIAKSYEMKVTDVNAGTPIWDAKKSCPTVCP